MTEIPDEQRWSAALRSTADALESVASNARSLLESDDWNDLAAAGIEIAHFTTRRDYESVPPPGEDEVNLLAAGDLALEALESLAEAMDGSAMNVGLSAYARPLSFWLGTFSTGYLAFEDQGDRFVERALKWPPVFGPLKSVLFTATPTAKGTLPLPWERDLLDRLVGYLSLPAFESDMEVFLEEGHLNLRNGEYGSAAAFFRGAAIHDPFRVEAHLGLVLAQHGSTYFENWVWGGPTLQEMETAILALGQAVADDEALRRWREGDAPRWHNDETDPSMLVAEGLARLHVVELLANPPAGLTWRWPLLQLRALFAPGRAGDEELHRRMRDLGDGQRAIYKRIDLGFQLGAKELSLVGLRRVLPTDSFAQARSTAAEELSKHLGDAWKRMQEPAKTYLFEAESLYQLQAPSRLGAPVAIIPAYTGALEGWLRTGLGGDQSLAGYGHDLRNLARYTDRFEVPTEQQQLYGRVSSAREFWCRVVPAHILDGGIHAVRNKAAHGKGSPTWDDVEIVRDVVLGHEGRPGLLAQAPDMPPLRY